MVLKKLGKTALLFILPALLLTGCSGDKDAVATMKGYSLTSEQFLNELNLIRTSYQMGSNSELSDEDTRILAKDTIKQLTLLEVFAKEGEKLKLNPSDEELNELFKVTKDQIASLDGMQDILDSSGYTDAILKESLYKSETAYAYYVHLCDSIAISGADAKSFFEENKDELYTTEEADAAHILFKTFSEDENGKSVPFSEDEKAAVKKKAEEVLKKVKSGENFNDLAKKYSEDEGTKEDGGELGRFPKGEMVPEFEAATFSLKDGETSEIVESPFGYHIIKLNKKSTSAYKFEDIASYVRTDLLDSLFLDEVKKLEKEYNIKINEDNVNELLNNLKPVPTAKKNSDDSKSKEKQSKTSNDEKKTETDK